MKEEYSTVNERREMSGGVEIENNLISEVQNFENENSKNLNLKNAMIFLTNHQNEKLIEQFININKNNNNISENYFQQIIQNSKINYYQIILNLFSKIDDQIENLVRVSSSILSATKSTIKNFENENNNIEEINNKINISENRNSFRSAVSQAGELNLEKIKINSKISVCNELLKIITINSSDDENIKNIISLTGDRSIDSSKFINGSFLHSFYELFKKKKTLSCLRGSSFLKMTKNINNPAQLSSTIQNFLNNKNNNNEFTKPENENNDDFDISCTPLFSSAFEEVVELYDSCIDVMFSAFQNHSRYLCNLLIRCFSTFDLKLVNSLLDVSIFQNSKISFDSQNENLSKQQTDNYQNKYNDNSRSSLFDGIENSIFYFYQFYFCVSDNETYSSVCFSSLMEIRRLVLAVNFYFCLLTTSRDPKLSSLSPGHRAIQILSSALAWVHEELRNEFEWASIAFDCSKKNKNKKKENLENEYKEFAMEFIESSFSGICLCLEIWSSHFTSVSPKDSLSSMTEINKINNSDLSNNNNNNNNLSNITDDVINDENNSKKNKLINKNNLMTSEHHNCLRNAFRTYCLSESSHWLTAPNENNNSNKHFDASSILIIAYTFDFYAQTFLSLMPLSSPMSKLIVVCLKGQSSAFELLRLALRENASWLQKSTIERHQHVSKIPDCVISLATFLRDASKLFERLFIQISTSEDKIKVANRSSQFDENENKILKLNSEYSFDFEKDVEKFSLYWNIQKMDEFSEVLDFAINPILNICRSSSTFSESTKINNSENDNSKIFAFLINCYALLNHSLCLQPEMKNYVKHPKLLNSLLDEQIDLFIESETNSLANRLGVSVILKTKTTTETDMHADMHADMHNEITTFILQAASVSRRISTFFSPLPPEDFGQLTRIAARKIRKDIRNRVLHQLLDLENIFIKSVCDQNEENISIEPSPDKLRKLID